MSKSEPETTLKRRGIIFDCDGVLVDSEPFSCGALNVLFEESFDPPVDIGTNYNDVLGKSTLDVLRHYHQVGGTRARVLIE